MSQMRRHLWFPFLSGTACVVCGEPKRDDTLATACRPLGRAPPSEPPPQPQPKDKAP